MGCKYTTNQMHALDIRNLKKLKLLTPGRSIGWDWTRSGLVNVDLKVGSDKVTLSYEVQLKDGSLGHMEYPVWLTRTDCNYGGQRVWWQCPICGRRVAVLYAGQRYARRKCHDLTYKSTRTVPGSAFYARANKVRMKLGWGGGIASPMGDRPKGMHATTYLRLLTELNAHGIGGLESTDKQFSRWTAKLKSITKRLGVTTT